MHSVNSLLNLSIPDVHFPVLLSTLIRSQFQAKPATLLIPINFSLLFVVEELDGTRYQSGSFSLINVGSGFQSLRSFSFFSFLAHRLAISFGQFTVFVHFSMKKYNGKLLK